ncbi:MAG TPA: NUDIX domain-containing protein [Thermomicrobiales bacterium]|nr:NUDIX domain-containing protein [Thermomicrobiales bacterium]
MSERAQDPSELFDVLTAEGASKGFAKKRSEVHRDGDWHGSIHVWVYGVDRGIPYLAFQRRGRFKDTLPLKLDATVGGHLRTGESVEQTLREVQEEIGRGVAMAELLPIGIRLGVSEDVRGIIDREIQHVYFWRVDEPLTTFAPNPDELESLVQLPLEDVLAIFGEGIVAADALELRAGSAILTPVLITRSEFADGIDRYPYRVAIAASNALRGDRYVAI